MLNNLENSLSYNKKDNNFDEIMQDFRRFN